MAKCNINTLLASNSGFATRLSSGEMRLARLALLLAWLQRLSPSYVLNINQLLASGKCFHCLSSGEKKLAKLQLLCEILNNTTTPAPTVAPYTGVTQFSFTITGTDSSMTVVATALVNFTNFNNSGIFVVSYASSYGSARTVNVSSNTTPPNPVVEFNTSNGFTIGQPSPTWALTSGQQFTFTITTS